VLICNFPDSPGLVCGFEAYPIIFDYPKLTTNQNVVYQQYAVSSASK